MPNADSIDRAGGRPATPATAGASAPIERGGCRAVVVQLLQAG